MRPVVGKDTKNRRYKLQGQRDKSNDAINILTAQHLSRTCFIARWVYRDLESPVLTTSHSDVGDSTRPALISIPWNVPMAAGYLFGLGPDLRA